MKINSMAKVGRVKVRMENVRMEKYDELLYVALCYTQQFYVRIFCAQNKLRKGTEGLCLRNSGTR